MFKTFRKYIRNLLSRIYRQRRRRFILDIGLIAAVFILAVAVFTLKFYKPEINTFSFIAPNKPGTVVPAASLEMLIILDNKSSLQPVVSELQVSLKNNGDREINDLKLTFPIQTSSFSLAEIELVAEEAIVENNTILVSALAPGEDKQLDLRFRFNQLNQTARLLSWQAVVEYKISGHAFTEKQTLSDITVAAKLPAQAAAYYNSPQGDQLGSGPLPPVVGVPTNYWIFWRVLPGTDFTDFVMSARLPKNVSLVNNSALLAGDLNYNAGASQVVWKVDKLLAQGQDYRAGFEVQLIPEEGQAGKIVNLVENIRFSARDVLTGLTVEGRADVVTTNLDSDSLNRGEGQVLKLEDL